MTPRCLLLLAAAAVSGSWARAEEKPLRVLYIGAEADSGRGLFRRWCEVIPARLGGPAHWVGDQEARDLAVLRPTDWAAVSVAFLDADAAEAAGKAQVAALVQYVNGGGKLVVEGSDAYLDLLADILPLERAAPRLLTGAGPKVADAQHPAVIGVPLAAWNLEGTEVAGRPARGGRALVEADGAALVTVGKAGQGKVVATPLSHLAERYSWRRTPGYDSLLTLLALALAGAPDEALLRESWGSAFRYWMYGGFPVGYHKYRFGLTGEAVAAYDEAETKLTDARSALDLGDLPRCRDLLQAVLGPAQKAVAAAREIGGTLPATDAEAASLRRDLLRLPGTLDVVHGMNLSEGPSGCAPWWPASGRELLDNRPALDLPPGASDSFWRGLHPYVRATASLPSDPDADRLRQRRADGTRIDGPSREIWVHPAVKALQAQTFGYAHDGLLLNEGGGAEWNTYGSTTDADFSEFAQRAFRLFLADQGLSPGDVGAGSWEQVALPVAWAPTRLYYEWQAFRGLYLAERLKTSDTAMKLVAPGALSALQPGSLGDPWRVGLGPEAAPYVDLLCPQIMRGQGAKADPVEVELSCRQLLSLVDDDGDGAPDREPGFAARFGWSQPLSLSPAEHRSAAAIALLTGARGIMEQWAPDGMGGDAVATMPEEVFLRWQAAFEPSLRHEDLLLSSAPARADIGVWDSWHSAAMAEGGGEPDGPDTWSLSQPREWAALLIRAGFVPRFVSDRHVQMGEFAGLRCLVVPSTLCVSDDEKAKLAAFCEQGGTLLLGCSAGAFDACHVPRDRGLGVLAGVTPGQPVAGKDRLKGQASARWTKDMGTGALVLGDVTQSLKPGADAEVVATANGGPVACLRKAGKGAVVYVGATVWAGDGAAQILLRQVLESLGHRRLAYAADARGGWAWQARVLVMARPKGALVGLAHYRPYGDQEPLSGLTVRLRLPEGRYAVARLSDARPYVRNDKRSEAVSASFEDGYLTFPTDLRPAEVRFFLIDPA